MAVCVGLVALVAILLVAGETYDTVKGCGSVDPTDPSNYTIATIKNDTPNAVSVDACTGTYCSLDTVSPLLPGQSLQIRGACGASGDQMTSYQVSRGGTTIGYVAIETTKSRTGVTYVVSHLSPNRTTPTRLRSQWVPTG
jgi:hypothetical protein